MAYNQTTTTTITNSNNSGNSNNRSSKGNRMHPYLELIHRDMVRTYEALQVKIHRSRMQSTQAANEALSTHNINNNNKTSAQGPMVSFSAVVESLLNQFSDYQASQENSFEQLTTSLASGNNSNDDTITTSPTDNEAPTAMGTPPLSPVCRSDLMQNDSSRSPVRSMNLDMSLDDMAEIVSPCASELTSGSSANTSSPPAEMHFSNNNQQHLMDKGMDLEKDTAPPISNPTVIKEHTSMQALLPTNSVVDIGFVSSPSLESVSNDTALSLDKVANKQKPTESTSIRTNTLPTTNSMPGSISSSSPALSKELLTYRKSKDPSPSTVIPLPPSPSVRTSQPKPLLIKYNADSNLTLPDFVSQLKEVFDSNPTVFKTDADRVKYALHSMGVHTARYFEPFLNKSVPDSRRCLTSYDVFLKTLEDKFGEAPSLETICAATTHLVTLQQTGAMCTYTAAFQDLTAIVRWEESHLMHMFVEGISSEVRALLGYLSNIQSLSMLQVAAARAYSMHRVQPHSWTYDQHRYHSTSFYRDLDWARDRLRRQNQRIYSPIRESMGLSTKCPPLALTAIRTSTSSTDVDTDAGTGAVSPTATANPVATATDNGRISLDNPAGRYIRSHPRGKLTEEVKQYRKDNHLCFYCGGESHSSSTCPLKKPKDKKKVEH